MTRGNQFSFNCWSKIFKNWPRIGTQIEKIVKISQIRFETKKDGKTGASSFSISTFMGVLERIVWDSRTPRRVTRSQSGKEKGRVNPSCKEGYAGGEFITPWPRGRADCIRFAMPAEAICV